MEQAPRSNALGSTQEQCYPSQEQARSKPGAILPKAANCDAYWQARDPTDMVLHAEGAGYYILEE